MLKKIIASLSVVVATLYAAASFAAVDVNKASAAELDSIKGIGPAISSRIVEERKKGNFKDWADLENRVSGIKDKKAAALSSEGLTVNGTSYAGAAPKADAKKAEDKKSDGKKTDDKSSAKLEGKDGKANATQTKPNKEEAKPAPAADKAAALEKPKAGKAGAKEDKKSDAKDSKK